MTAGDFIHHLIILGHAFDELGIGHPRRFKASREDLARLEFVMRQHSYDAEARYDPASMTFSIEIAGFRFEAWAGQGYTSPGPGKINDLQHRPPYAAYEEAASGDALGPPIPLLLVPPPDPE